MSVYCVCLRGRFGLEISSTWRGFRQKQTTIQHSNIPFLLSVLLDRNLERKSDFQTSCTKLYTFWNNLCILHRICAFYHGIYSRAEAYAEKTSSGLNCLIRLFTDCLNGLLMHNSTVECTNHAETCYFDVEQERTYFRMKKKDFLKCEKKLFLKEILF